MSRRVAVRIFIIVASLSTVAQQRHHTPRGLAGIMSIEYRSHGPQRLCTDANAAQLAKPVKFQVFRLAEPLVIRYVARHVYEPATIHLSGMFSHHARQCGSTCQLRSARFE